MKKLILLIIVGYKKIFFLFRCARLPVFLYTDCKFIPSCSDYTAESINKHGVCKGLIRSSIRILKCSPFSRGGLDLP